MPEMINLLYRKKRQETVCVFRSSFANLAIFPNDKKTAKLACSKLKFGEEIRLAVVAPQPPPLKLDQGGGKLMLGVFPAAS